MAANDHLLKEMETLKPLIDGRQQNQIKDFQKQITEARTDLESSLDKPDQAKSPEHLYGAASNLQQRLARAAEAARGIALAAATKSNQLREQFARHENPAIVALQEAKSALNQAISEAKSKDPKKREREDKEGLKAPEKAASCLSPFQIKTCQVKSSLLSSLVHTRPQLSQMFSRIFSSVSAAPFTGNHALCLLRIVCPAERNVQGGRRRIHCRVSVRCRQLRQAAARELVRRLC
jgi:hypothetical protein